MFAQLSYSRESSDYHYRIYSDNKEELYADFVYRVRNSELKSVSCFNYKLTWSTFSEFIRSFATLSPLYLKNQLCCRLGKGYHFSTEFLFQ